MIYTIHAKALTPLSFRAGRNTTDAATLDYIPGSAVLGALYNAHTQLRRPQAELSTFLFNEITRAGNLYPATLPDDDNDLSQRMTSLQETHWPVYPLPATAHSCKRFGGFFYDAGGQGDHHGVFDHLLPWAVFVLSNQTEIGLLETNKRCGYAGVCGEERSSMSGYYRRGAAPEQWARPQIKQLLRTHTGINRTTGTVQEGILFSRSVLVEQSEFSGTLHLDEEVASDFAAFVQEASQAGLIRVGSNRSRGMGRIEVTLTELKPDTPDSLGQRLETFNTQLKALIQAHGLKSDYSLYVPLTLTSDTIVVDHLLRYYTYLAPAYLDEVWDIGKADLVYSQARTRQVMGWNSLWRLPRADELAISKGSVFLLGLPTELDQNLVSKLFNLQSAGLGLRRHEGFGQVIVADSFHWEAHNV